MATSLKVAVIGAGVAGLCAARELQREDHQVVVFEKSNRLGGTWVYDPRVESDPLGLDPNREIVHGSLYKSLRTNIPRALMGFTDFKFIDKVYSDPRTFPGHEEVLKFLEDFASHFKLVDLIRFDTEVTRVKLADSEIIKFVVESKTSGGSLVDQVFDAVVVCNGHHTVPRVDTKIPGIDTWSKKQMHSHNYRDPEPYKDQIVVIIGGSASALDISREIAMVAKQVHISARSSHIKVSNPEKFNNIWQHPKVVCVHKDGTVTFQDGFSIEPDIIVHCTGYEFHIPFLGTSDIINVQDKRAGPLYKHVFPPQLAPGLSFVGIPDKNPAFVIAEYQSRWIAQALSGKVSLPSEYEMFSDVEDYYQEMEEKGVPKRYTHSLEFKGDYLDWLCAQLGTVVEPKINDIYECLLHSIFTDIDAYRDTFIFKGI